MVNDYFKKEVLWKLRNLYDSLLHLIYSVLFRYRNCYLHQTILKKHITEKTDASLLLQVTLDRCGNIEQQHF